MTECATDAAAPSEEKPLSPMMCALAMLWVLLGLVAFYRSLRCFGKSGSSVDKIFGFLLAVVMGPVYFIFSHENKNYCR
mgnify:CR=1 FL=1|tara:strand:- start:343 stop:579 length:237 start_codon:yes stop_codon:yes gene_type:complete